MLTFPGVPSLDAARRGSPVLDVVLAAAGDTVTGSNRDNAFYITGPGTRNALGGKDRFSVDLLFVTPTSPIILGDGTGPDTVRANLTFTAKHYSGMVMITTGTDMVLTLKGAARAEASNTEILFQHAESQRIDQATVIGGAEQDFSVCGSAIFRCLGAAATTS